MNENDPIRHGILRSKKKKLITNLSHLISRSLSMFKPQTLAISSNQASMRHWSSTPASIFVFDVSIVTVGISSQHFSLEWPYRLRLQIEQDLEREVDDCPCLPEQVINLADHGCGNVRTVERSKRGVSFQELGGREAW